MANIHIVVRAIWDTEAEVWVATSDDVPGLVTEAASVEELSRKLMVMVPELLVENDVVDPAIAHEIPFDLIAQQSSKLRFHAAE